MPRVSGPRDRMEGLRLAVSARLKARRDQLGLTQPELADKAGIGRSIVANVEMGRSLPSLTVYVDLCRAMDLDPGPLLREPACSRCGDIPPPGFICGTCGAGADHD